MNINFTLRHKINFAILATFILISIIVGIIQFLFQAQRFHSMLDKNELLIQTLVQRDKDGLANEIFDKNIRAIKIRLTNMAKVKGIEAISVFDKSGHFLASCGEINTNKNTAATDTYRPLNNNLDKAEQKNIIKNQKNNSKYRSHTNFLEYSQPINVIGERIGYIKIYYSLADIKKARQQSYLIYVSLLIMILIVMLIQLNFILSKTIIKPITFLRDAMEHIRIKKYGEQLDVKTKDEIGDLSRTFNKMSMELARSYGEIENQNKKLIKNEKEINEVRSYLKSIIDSMPSILVGVDKQEKITRWNREAEEFTGITPKDAEGQLFKDVFLRYGFQKIDIKKSIKTKAIQNKTQLSVIKDGQTKYFDITIYPLMGSGLAGAVIRIDDATEHVRLEEIMIQSEKMRSIGGLAAGMAHEINNPLAGILQNTAVVKNRLEADIPANHIAAKAAGTDMAAIQTFMKNRDIFRMLSNIKESGIRAAEIVKDMLSFARKSEGNFSPYYMDKLLEETLKLASAEYDLKKHFDFKNIIIKREYEQNLPEVFCHKGQIQQVFFNIFKNGAQAMAESREKKHSATPQFILRLKRKNDSVRIEIEDSGPGMDEKISKRIFEPFFTTKPVGVGTGLGMSVSYFIITHTHKGSIEVETYPEKGTKFIITLPIQFSTIKSNEY